MFASIFFFAPARGGARQAPASGHRIEVATDEKKKIFSHPARLLQTELAVVARTHTHTLDHTTRSHTDNKTLVPLPFFFFSQFSSVMSTTTLTTLSPTRTKSASPRPPPFDLACPKFTLIEPSRCGDGDGGDKEQTWTLVGSRGTTPPTAAELRPFARYEIEPQPLPPAATAAAVRDFVATLRIDRDPRA